MEPGGGCKLDELARKIITRLIGKRTDISEEFHLASRVRSHKLYFKKITVYGKSRKAYPISSCRGNNNQQDLFDSRKEGNA